MADRSVRFRLFGDDVTASSSLDKVGRTADRTHARLTKLGGGIGAVTGKLAAVGAGAAKVGLLAAAAASATSSVAGLAGAAATASGALLVLPAAGLAGAAAMGTLKLGVLGVADAFKAGLDPAKAEEFAAAMKGLAPAARETVRATLALKPAFDAMKLDVQGQLFDGLGRRVKELGTAYLPILRKGLSGIASTMNLVGQRSLNVLMEPRSLADTRNGLESTREAVARLAPAGQAVVRMFRDVGAVGAQYLPRLAKGFSDAATKAADLVAGMRRSGALNEMIEQGGQALAQLGRIAGNVGGALKGIFDATQAAGSGGLLNTVADVTEALNGLVNSTGGQAGLTALFKGVGDGVRGFLAGFREAGPLLGQLGPLVGELARQVGTILGKALGFVIPLLTQAAPAVRSLLTTIGGAIQGFFALLSTPNPGAMSALQPIIDGFNKLKPVFFDLKNFVIGLFQQLIPQVQANLTLVIGIVGKVMEAFAAFWSVFGPQIKATITALFTGIMSFINGILTAVSGILDVFIGVLTGDWSRAWEGLKAIFSGAWTAITAVLSTGLALMQAKVSGVLSAVQSAFSSAWNSVLGFVSTIPGRITGFFAGVGAWFIGLGNTVSAAFRQWAGNISSAVSGIPGRIRGFFAGIGAFFTGLASTVTGAFASWAGRIAGTVSGIPGQIVGFFSGLPGQFAGIGANIISALAGGIQSMAGRVAESARSVVGNAISSAKSALGISSPSKVFLAIGRDVGRGFVKGIAGSKADVVRVMNKLFDDVKKIGGRRGRTALRVVTATRTRLVNRAAGRDAVTARLAKAREQLGKLRGDYASNRANVRSGVLGTGNVVGRGQENQLPSILARMRQAVARARAFAAVVEQLRRRGLNRGSLQQLIEAGPEAGMAAARSLARGGVGALNQVNRLQAQLGKAGDRLGVTSSEAMYGAGIRAAAGLVKGLESQRARLDRMMQALAASMVKALKKALKIRSPSRVYEGLGHQVGAGLVRGLDGSRPDAAAASARLLAGTRGPAPTGRLRTGSRAVGGTVVQLHLNGATYVGNEQQLAKVVVSALGTARRRGVLPAGALTG